MTKTEALRFVNAEIARIERENPDAELRPWSPDAAPAALEHWGRIQQRIALTNWNARGKAACCAGFHIKGVVHPNAQRNLDLYRGKTQAQGILKVSPDGK